MAVRVVSNVLCSLTISVPVIYMMNTPTLTIQYLLHMYAYTYQCNMYMPVISCAIFLFHAHIEYNYTYIQYCYMLVLMYCIGYLHTVQVAYSHNYVAIRA